jgi:hypothetical protein
LNLIFGPKSNIGRVLEEKLGINNDELCKILGTYSLAAAYNLSKMQLFSKNSLVNFEGLTDEKTYQSFWNSIARSGCNEQGALARGVKPL